MKSLALAVLLAALALPASAQSDLAVFGEAGYGGSGCPDGTARIVAAFDSSSIALFPDAYSVGDNGRSLDRKTCAIAIPVSVPDGMQVAIRGIAFLGTAILPAGLDATLSAEAFTAGDSGEVTELPLTGPSTGPYFRFLTIPEDKLVWSGCGEDVNLRLNTSLRAKGNESASVTLDAINIFRVATKAC